MNAMFRGWVVVAALWAQPLAALAAIAPLPPIPDTLPTDQFAVDNPFSDGPDVSDDKAWLAPVKDAADDPAPSTPASTETTGPPLEGPPTPLPPLERLSSGGKRSPRPTTASPSRST
jgi:type IV pilus assembly protein PilQ